MTHRDHPPLSPRDEALLAACAWLENHPENVDGADRSGVLRVIRRLEGMFGKLVWPPEAEIPEPRRPVEP